MLIMRWLGNVCHIAFSKSLKEGEEACQSMLTKKRGETSWFRCTGTAPLPFAVFIRAECFPSLLLASLVCPDPQGQLQDEQL